MQLAIVRTVMALIMALALAFMVGALVNDTLGQVTEELERIGQSMLAGDKVSPDSRGVYDNIPEPWGDCEEDEAWVPATYGIPGSREDIHGVNRVCSPIDEDI